MRVREIGKEAFERGKEEVTKKDEDTDELRELKKRETERRDKDRVSVRVKEKERHKHKVSV